MNLQRLHNITRELIAIDSVTGNEAEIVEFMYKHLCERGMSVKLLPVDEGRKNILAAFSPQPPKILFNTHLDTVPVQYGPHEDAQRIYGRGACDTHGILAAQLEAIEDLHSDDVVEIGILLVVGEEATHDGALQVGHCKSIYEPDVLIVGEPTENKLMNAQLGRLKLELAAYGREGHSGYPQEFDSAVDKLITVLSAIRNADWVKDDSSEGTTVNIILKEGGHADNQIPAFAQARLMFRCAEPCELIKQKVRQLVDRVATRLGASKIGEPHFELNWGAAQNDPVSMLATIPGFETGTAAFNTDISYLGWKKCKTFLVGPGSILNAHKDLNGGNWLQGEWILKENQLKGVEIYKKLVKRLL